MADRTAVRLTRATWNPIAGSGIGSRNRRDRARAGDSGRARTREVRLDERQLTAPLRWRKPRHIVVCPSRDLFDDAVPVQWIDCIHAVMALAPRHIFQVLTRCSERMFHYYGDRDADEHVRSAAASLWHGHGPGPGSLAFEKSIFFPLPNLWLGVTVEDREREWRIHNLRDTPAALRFVSFDPLLEDVCPLDLDGLDWAIVGGDSGPRARPVEPAWVRRLRDRCRDQDVAFFFRQWGGPRPKTAGRLLDGVLHDAIPEPLDNGSWLIPLQHDDPDLAFDERRAHDPPSWWGHHRDPSRTTPDGRPPQPKDFAMMFESLNCAWNRAARVATHRYAEIEFREDFCSGQYYLVMHRKTSDPPEGRQVDIAVRLDGRSFVVSQRTPGAVQEPRFQKVLCQDGRWRQRSRVRLRGGHPA